MKNRVPIISRNPQRSARWTLALALVPILMLGCGGTDSTSGPMITSFSPTSGVYSSNSPCNVTVYGAGFLSGIRSVSIGSVTVSQTTGTSYTDTQLEFTLPSDAVTGTINVTTPDGTASTSQNFIVIPTMDNSGSIGTNGPFTGTSGGATAVNIYGWGLKGISSIVLTNQSDTSQTFTIYPNSSTTANQLQFSVPATPTVAAGTYTMSLQNVYGLPYILTPTFTQN